MKCQLWTPLATLRRLKRNPSDARTVTLSEVIAGFHPQWSVIRSSPTCNKGPKIGKLILNPNDDQ